MKKIFDLDPNFDLQRDNLVEEIIKWLEDELEEGGKYQLIVEVLENK